MAIFGVDLKQLLFGAHKKNLLAAKTPLQLCGIQFYADGIAVACISRHKEKPVLDCYDFLDCNMTGEKYLPVLSRFVKKNKLENVNCSWILQPADYLLLPVGVLPVAAGEIDQALHFNLKNRINFGPSQACITHFTLPPISKSSKDDFIYGVAAKLEILESMTQLIRQSGLVMHSIDIPEFALRNIVNLYAAYSNHHGNIGFLEADETHLTLIFIQKGVIHLIRQIEWNKQAANSENIKKLSSEIQRSLDYYENELGQLPIHQFYILPAYQEFFPELITLLPFDLKALTLEGIFDLPLDSHKNNRCFTVIGGALRQEGKTDAAN